MLEALDDQVDCLVIGNSLFGRSYLERDDRCPERSGDVDVTLDELHLLGHTLDGWLNEVVRTANGDNLEASLFGQGPDPSEAGGVESQAARVRLWPTFTVVPPTNRLE